MHGFHVAADPNSHVSDWISVLMKTEKFNIQFAYVKSKSFYKIYAVRFYLIKCRAIRLILY